MRFVSFYYPGYDICERRNISAGRRIDEWEIFRTGPPSPFVDEARPQPISGFTRPSDPSVILQEARLAREHAIDAWVFNHYFDGLGFECDQAIRTFASLPTTETIAFAVNLCYKMPKRDLPILHSEREKPAAYIFDPTEAQKNLVIKLDLSQVQHLFRHLATSFFTAPNYLRIDDACFVSIYHVAGLLQAYGVDGLNEYIATARREAAIFGHRLFVVGLMSVSNEERELTDMCNQVAFDGFSCYCSLPDFRSTLPVQQYDALAQRRAAEWWECHRYLDKPYLPCVAAGWDATSRGSPGYDPRVHGLQFPFAPVVVGDTAENFERYLTKAVDFAEATRAPLVMLGPWNEWTEGCYLLPDTKYGIAKLRSVLRTKQRIEAWDGRT